MITIHCSNGGISTRSSHNEEKDMPKQQAQNLITELHERFADDEVSAQQADLMMRLNAHIHELGEEDPVDPSMLDAVELYMGEVEADHPQVAAVVKQLLETLKNIGI